MFERDHDFSFGTSFAKIAGRGRNFRQRIQPIDDRDECASGAASATWRIFLVWLHRQDAYLPALGSCSHGPRSRIWNSVATAPPTQ